MPIVLLSFDGFLISEHNKSQSKTIYNFTTLVSFEIVSWILSAPQYILLNYFNRFNKHTKKVYVFGDNVLHSIY